jgi:hypothetical protein
MGYVSRYMEKPAVEHLAVVKRILRYVARMHTLGCFMGRDALTDDHLVSYSNNNMARDLDDRNSGVLFFLGNYPVS